MSDQELVNAADLIRLSTALELLGRVVPESHPAVPRREHAEVLRALRRWSAALRQEDQDLRPGRLSDRR